MPSHINIAPKNNIQIQLGRKTIKREIPKAAVI